MISNEVKRRLLWNGAVFSVVELRVLHINVVHVINLI